MTMMTIEWIKKIKETSGKMWIADDATVSMLCDTALAVIVENEQLKRDLSVWETLKTEINDIENEKNSNQ